MSLQYLVKKNLYFLARNTSNHFNDKHSQHLPFIHHVILYNSLQKNNILILTFMTECANFVLNLALLKQNKNNSVPHKRNFYKF